jgi:thiamine-monophosphate kinase
MVRFPASCNVFMDEFGRIAHFFAPLASGFSGSLNLRDDAALLAPSAGHELVITKDALSEGVHFLGSESAGLIASKALRTNLSDLAAKGAKPLVYFLALMLPPGTGDAWLEAFCAGLENDQKIFGISLAGGDTISTHGKLSISITAIGEVPLGSMLKRSGAQAGDAIYVSGTLGDSALGLRSLQNGLGMAALEERYLLPQPRTALGLHLRTLAHACMDVSDGLVQDLGHICAASGVGALVHTPNIPLSPEAATQPGALTAALSGGDDYELLFTSPASAHAALEALSAEVGVRISRIGEVVSGSGVRVLDASGDEVKLTSTGYVHR